MTLSNTDASAVGFVRSARLEAAMTSVREDLQHVLHHSPRRIATRALSAADSVMFSEAAIERAAIQVFALNFDPATWSWKSHENDRQSCRNLVLAVVAALREDT